MSYEDLTSIPILLVDDDPLLLKEQEFRLRRNGFNPTVSTSGEDALKRLEEGFEPYVIVLDLLMPGIGGLETLRRIRTIDPELPVVVVSAQEKVSTAIQTLREGAYDYLIKPVTDEVLTSTVRHAIAQRKVTLELTRLRKAVKHSGTFDRLIGQSQPMRKIFRLIERTLHNDITVLILGESGTGKELVARAIHTNGVRSEKPFVVVNCAAIPRELVESELFGHEKGSFTGALERKIGKFELADGGTLFLDEIGELDHSVQAKLLRALQEREIERVGGTKTIKVDVRLICATQRDLEVEVAEDRFREDLYYRINAFPITMPPLRDREGDVELLVGHFLDKHAKHLGRQDIRGFTPGAVRALSDFDWPGNVRQLENVITRAMVMSETDVISSEDLPDNIRIESDDDLGTTATKPSFLEDDENVIFTGSSSYITEAPITETGESNWPQFETPDDVPSLEEIKAWAIKEAYEACNHNISLTSKKLGLGRATLYRMLEKYDIQPENDEELEDSTANRS